MNALGIVNSLNKIGIVFFILTLLALIYEIRLFKKDRGNKAKPIIPDFDGNHTIEHFTPIDVSVDKKSSKKASPMPIILTGAFLVIFGIISVLGLSLTRKPSTKNQTTAPAPTSIVPAQKLLKSEGISVYSQDWTEIEDEKVATLSAGSKINIGIHTVPNGNVDRARIRVNQKQWLPEHITQDLDKSKQVYFVPYSILGTEENIQIEAQLHSKSGWPNEN